MNQYKGFELFNDVEDDGLRAFNRATVLRNISQDYSKDQKISHKGLALILGYFGEIPMAERMDVRDNYVKLMKEQGWALVNG